MLSSEKTTQTKLLKWLKTLTPFAGKHIQANTNGWPDIFACVAGIYVGIEVKDKGKKPTKLQEVKLQQLRDAGGIGFYTDDVDSAKETLLAELYKRVVPRALVARTGQEPVRIVGKRAGYHPHDHTKYTLYTLEDECGNQFDVDMHQMDMYKHLADTDLKEVLKYI